MTGHFTTVDGCERWGAIVEPASEYYRVPFSYSMSHDLDYPFSSPGISYAYRMYKLESVDYARGLVNYVEVYNG